MGNGGPDQKENPPNAGPAGQDVVAASAGFDLPGLEMTAP